MTDVWKSDLLGIPRSSDLDENWVSEEEVVGGEFTTDQKLLMPRNRRSNRQPDKEIHKN